MNVLVTGAGGFIGKNLIADLAQRPGVEVFSFGRDSTQEDLQRGVAAADFICHLAGVNRPDDPDEFQHVNRGLTETLCQMVRAGGRRIPIIFASSVHADTTHHADPRSLAAVYGASKAAAEEALLHHAEAARSPVYIFRLPHVVGKWCRPNYNSVVATFCHNIARNLPIQVVDPAFPLTLVYVDDLVAAFARIIAGDAGAGGYREVEPRYSTTVGELASQLRAFHASRQSLITERVGTGLTRALYATYLSYLPLADFAYTVPKYGDDRGVFVEVLKTKDSGQVSFFTAHPGVTRGGHYHHSKTEKFLVLRGRARFRFRHILTNETHEILTSGHDPQIVEMIPGWTHEITNIGDEEMVVLLWANEVFDRSRPDTVISPVST